MQIKKTDEIIKFEEALKKAKLKQKVHISEYSDSNAGVVPDTFAMRFSRL